MKAVTLSKKAQIVLPKDVSDAAGLQIGARLMLIPEGTSIHLVPLHDIDSYRGMLAGSNPDGYREHRLAAADALVICPRPRRGRRIGDQRCRLCRVPRGPLVANAL